MKCTLINCWCSYCFRGMCWYHFNSITHTGQVELDTITVEELDKWCFHSKIGISWDLHGSYLLSKEMTIKELVEEMKFMEWLEKNVVSKSNSFLDNAVADQIKGFAYQARKQCERCIEWRLNPLPPPYSNTTQIGREEEEKKEEEEGEWV